MTLRARLDCNASTPWCRWNSLLPFAVVVLCCFARPGPAQQYTAVERDQAQAMLRDVADDVKRHYFDPLALNDWDARVLATKEKIEHSDSINQALSHIAALLDSLNDSHTFFLPPARPYRNDYGFQMQMVGDRCLVTHVRPGSDADMKGVKPGAEIVTVDGYAPTREDVWRMKYLFWILQPQAHLRLVLRDANGARRAVDVAAKFRQSRENTAKDMTGGAIFDELRDLENQQDGQRPVYAERGNALLRNALLVVRLPEFSLSASDVVGMLEKMRRHPAVVLDLRGNPGGNEDSLLKLLGGIFDRKVKIGDALTSRSTQPIETAPRRRTFAGRLAVLIDSQSGSAAEVFARVVQLQKRGMVIGDRSAGKVMAAQQYMSQTGADTRIVYGATITKAQIRMADGQTLEHVGVIPDRAILPTAEDIAGGRDPVLAAAAETLGVTIDAEQAGALFPFHWPKD